MRTEKNRIITKEILYLFEKTFEKAHGSYLDRDASIFETINTISSKEASKKRGDTNATIAGHIDHIKFYIIVLQEYITDKRTGKTDWNESWKTKTVNDNEWELLKTTLHQEYKKLYAFLQSIDEWESGDYFGGIISILAHCSYHLGAIRQLIRV
jgi:hypothetical protein